ncbi:uncharacterized protein METZ01_LOCUS205540, partial [marine metagenome]
VYLFDLGYLVLVFVLDIVYPEIGWLVEMTIGIDYSKSLTNFTPLSKGFGKRDSIIIGTGGYSD